MDKIKGLLKALRDILYPKLCLACKEKLTPASVDEFVCPECWAKIKKNNPPFCRRCGRELKQPALAKNICPGCIRRQLHFDRAMSACSYEGVIKELIREFKYKNKDYLGHRLSRLLAGFIKEFSIPLELIDWIIPIPLHTARMREREFNQAQVLAQYLADEFKINLLCDNLIRHRRTKQQADLEGEERILNVKDSFMVKRSAEIKNKNILLVDDVLTTGATSSEAAYALKQAGANMVFVATLAN